jgi:nucleotide-binding universal stress UspA family protein
VDGSDLSVLALSWAVAEARLWGGSVEAVNVWTYPYASALPFAPVCDPGDIEEGARAALGAAVARVSAAGGPVVERVLVEGQPAYRLTDYAAEADMLVVGSRGRGGFKGLVLGSVSSQCVRHAPCPTVVVRSQA